jgi:hypothetical protein
LRLEKEYCTRKSSGGSSATATPFLLFLDADPLPAVLKEDVEVASASLLGLLLLVPGVERLSGTTITLHVFVPTFPAASFAETAMS